MRIMAPPEPQTPADPARVEAGVVKALARRPDAALQATREGLARVRDDLRRHEAPNPDATWGGRNHWVARHQELTRRLVLLEAREAVLEQAEAGGDVEIDAEAVGFTPPPEGMLAAFLLAARAPAVRSLRDTMRGILAKDEHDLGQVMTSLAGVTSAFANGTHDTTAAKLEEEVARLIPRRELLEARVDARKAALATLEGDVAEALAGVFKSHRKALAVGLKSLGRLRPEYRDDPTERRLSNELRQAEAEVDLLAELGGAMHAAAVERVKGLKADLARHREGRDRTLAGQVETLLDGAAAGEPRPLSELVETIDGTPRAFPEGVADRLLDAIATALEPHAATWAEALRA